MIPDSMRHIVFTPSSDPEDMKLDSSPVPQPAPGDLLIEVSYAGVNRPDLLQRAGLYPPPADASPVLGLEVAGRIAALGEGVTGWAIGDEVTALVPGGGYAEYCTAPAEHALPVPAGMSLAEAAGLPENWFTVWANLADHGRLAQGERLLVHGGSSGIGVAAIQLGTLFGCRVFTTVGSAEKADFCRRLGAELAINYREQDFASTLDEATDGEGVDVILDMIGAKYLQRNLGLLRRDGRLVFIAFLGGNRSEIDLLPIMVKRLTITGSTMRPRTRAEKASIRDALLERVWPALSDGRIRSHIHATYPLAEAPAAHRLMESSRHIGKIVLRVRD
ncbi:MAG: NAD(P)H-quinone oxidoreductase [Acidihalobacter sp.]|jgi:NADPH:quinone reductase